jgi:hypothetical protein
MTSASVPSPTGGDPVEFLDQPRPYSARSIRVELVIVFLVTLGLSGLVSLVDLWDALLAPAPLASQTVSIVVPQAQASFLDLFKQLLSILRGFAWGPGSASRRRSRGRISVLASRWRRSLGSPG